MRKTWTCAAVFLAAAFVLSSPLQAHKAQQSQLAGWWDYDKECPASDNGFGLASDGTASDGSGVYTGQWSLRKDQITIIWNAAKSERRHIERSKWHIVENFRMVREPQQRAMLVNIKNREHAWLCREY